MERFSDFDLLPEAILVHQGGYWVYANSAALRLLGARASDEVLGRPITAFVDPDYREVVAQRAENAASGSVNQAIELRLLRVDGSTIEVEGLSLPVVLGGGRGVLVHVRDVTERNRVAGTLRESEERFRATFEQAAVGIAHVALDGRWLRVNERFAAIVGYTRDELLDLDFQRITHPDDLAADLEYVRQLLEGEIESYSMDKRYLRKTGQPVWGRLTRSLVRAADGTPRYFITVVEDVDEKKAAEERLRRSESRFRGLIENGGDLIVVADASGRAMYRSPSIELLLGYGPASTGALPIIERVHPHDRPLVEAAFTRVLSQPGAQQRVTARFGHAEGEWRLLEAIATNLLGRDEIRGIVINARDITGRRLLEEQIEQAKRVESLGRVAATVVHEFNNVLMGIQPIATVIQRSYREDESLQKLAGLLLRAVGRGKQISDEILRFARPAQSVMQRFALRPWLEAIVEEFVAQTAGAVHVALRVDDTLPELIGDPSQLEQVLMNLFLNARDAMPQGGTITVEARRREHFRDTERDYVELRVTDEGSGMSEDVAQKVFEPLFTTKQKGTGLGLAVSYQIVKRHGGQISVRTALGEGSTFEILLPVAAEDTQGTT
jgi:two-component system cell cycle sensor histidine kinase/response regulator CckA